MNSTGRGYRRIGYVTRSEQDERVNQQWLGSLLAFQRELEPAARVEPLLSPDLTLPTFRAWMPRERPDVVISNLMEPVHLLKELGYAIPRDIGYASIDLAPEAFGIAGVDQLPVRVGAMAADLAIKQAQHNEFGLPKFPVDLRIDGVWRDGGTVRAVDSASNPARRRSPARTATDRSMSDRWRGGFRPPLQHPGVRIEAPHHLEGRRQATPLDSSVRPPARRSVAA